MWKRGGNCDAQRIAVLLNGEEDSHEFQEAASHLEACEQCQQQLTRLAADDDTWCNVAESLSTAADPPEPIALDFLAPPSHPEMLGRLGRYEIECVIGRGGMGIVLKGHDSELNRPVAIKVLAPHLAHNGPARQRFAREARAAAAVVHEHVVGIYDVQPSADMPYMVMQFVAGHSLQDRVDECGPLDVKELLRIGVQAAAGLAVAHAQGLVHRDIKPSNILLENDLERALLTDFGLVRAVDDATLTRSGAVAGTPHYMSPEQASGRPADYRSDLFSLGSVLYFMATGHPPFRAESAMGVLHRICNDRHRPAWEVKADIPDELSDIIDRLLEKKPQRRFANAEQVESALAATLARLQQPGQTRRRPVYRRFFRQLMRSHRRWLFGLLAAAGLATLGLSVTGSFREHQIDLPRITASNSAESGVARADQNAAGRFILRYDRNDDGELNGDEMRAGNWPADPENFDSDKNGRLSHFEIATRFAHNRQTRLKRGIEPIDRSYAITTIDLYDRTGDRRLDADELQASRLPKDLQFDADGNGLVTIAEIENCLSADRHRRGVSSIDQTNAQQFMRRYDKNGDAELDSEEMRLGGWPKDATKFDGDKNGRLTVAEVATQFAKSKAELDDQKKTTVDSGKTGKN